MDHAEQDYCTFGFKFVQTYARPLEPKEITEFFEEWIPTFEQHMEAVLQDYDFHLCDEVDPRSSRLSVSHVRVDDKFEYTFHFRWALAILKDHMDIFCSKFILFDNCN
jgi:hypothetical protein